jgi:hypothetical protein
MQNKVSKEIPMEKKVVKKKNYNKEEKVIKNV